MAIFDGFLTLWSSPFVFAYIGLGVFVGTMVGAMPGMSIAAVIALMVPITLYMDPLAALVFLYVLGKAGRYGGSIAAILFNTPGTVAAAATMQDGYPLSQQGRSTAALRMGTTASVAGDFIGDMLLIFGAVFIARYTEKLGPPEYFAIYCMAFIVIGSVVSDSVLKGIVSAALGVLFSLIGTDPITGSGRMTFGILELERGIGLIPMLVGVFVVSELFDQAHKIIYGKEESQIATTGPNIKGAAKISMKEWRICGPVIFRSSLIGAFIGCLPGLGSAVACFAAYGEEKRRAVRPWLWGKGAIEGVAAPEAANNAVSGPSMIPLMTLGVPGSTIAALLMGVFIIHGIQVGPSIFRTSHDLVYALFASGLVGIMGYGLFGFFLGPLIGRVIRKIDERYIYPFIFITSFMAAYTAASSFMDVYIMAIFGVLGYLMRRFNYPSPAFVIAFVLGKGAEESLRQSVLLSNQGLMLFLDRPVALAFMGVGLLVLVWRGTASLRRGDEIQTREETS